MEKPAKAAAVNATETAVTLPAPNFNVIRSESSAETIVNMEITAEMPPAHATGTFRFWLMVGHADPSSESGNPRLTNAT